MHGGPPAIKFRTEFISKYLRLVEDTESPRIFHVWSALAGVGACLGRRCFLPFGEDQIYPNMYVVLVGPPASRKNTAINLTRKLIKSKTQIRIAPDDTSGQKQGLIAAMLKQVEDGNDEWERLFNDAKSGGGLDMETLGEVKLTGHPADQHNMWVVATELNIFLGKNNMDLYNFLIKMYDGDEYSYRLKNSEMSFDDGLLSLLGGTTPTQIAHAFPPEASGGGFMSRMIFVYGGQVYKKIAWPIPMQQSLKNEIADIYEKVGQMSGAFTIADDARLYAKAVYESASGIEDVRFTYYNGRRYTHLLKLAMAFTASAGRMHVTIEDIEDADNLLALTEKQMPEALGEFGLSPIGAAKQKLLEYLNAVKEPVSISALGVLMQREMRPVDLQNTLTDLINAGKITTVHVTSESGVKKLCYISRGGVIKQTSIEAADLLSRFAEDME